MKRIFAGVSYLILLVVGLVYLCAGNVVVNGNSVSLLAVEGATALGVIAVILGVPAFILSIVSLCSGGKVITFIRDALMLFTSGFALANSIFALAANESNTVATMSSPIVIIICCVILLVFSVAGVAIGLISDSKKQAE